MSDQQPDTEQIDPRPSDAEPQPDLEQDGALSPGSSAEGSGTGDPEDAPVPAALRKAQHPDPGVTADSLVRGNRVATAEDME